MALTYFPFDAGAGANVTEDRWRDMARQFVRTGVLRAEGNAFAVSANAGMSVAVATGSAWVRGHLVKSDASESVAIAAAHATLERRDRVVLRADFTANTIAIVVLTGTPVGSNSTAPGLTQSTSRWEIPLATVLVPAADTVIDANQITDERCWANGPHAYTEKTASQTGITNAAVDLTDMTVTFNVSEPRRVRIAGEVSISSNVADDVISVIIADSANTVLKNSEDHVARAGLGTTVRVELPYSLYGVGRHTVKLRAQRVGGTGTLSTGPATLIVEDRGPA